jgi:hypothetical protein
VTIASVGGNTAANGDWVITKISDTTFSLDGSTGSGAYTSGGEGYHNIDETEQLTKTIWATGEANQVNFSLINPPLGFSIQPAGQNTGSNRHRTTLTCQPPEQGSLPKVVWVRVRANDGANTVDLVIKFNITDLNHEPEVWDDGNRVIYETGIHQQLSILFKAKDQDIPAQTLSFSLDATAGPYPNEGQAGYDGVAEGDSLPSGASINSSTGRFTWTPDTVGTYHITVRVTDNGTPNLDEIWTVKIDVVDVFQAGDCTNTYAGPHADIVASTETGGNEAWRAFDSTKTSAPGWIPSGALPQWLRYDFTAGNEKVIRHVTIYGYLSGAAFEIEASDDAASWTSLGTWSGVNGTRRQFDTKNRTPYRYYRINFTAGTSLEIYHVDLDCNIDRGEIFAIADDGSSTARLIAVDAGSGAVRDIAALSGIWSPYDPSEILGFAIDYRNKNSGTTTAWIALKSGISSMLLTVDLETGVCALVGQLISGTLVAGLIWDAVEGVNGLLYAPYGSGGTVYYGKVNTGTGAIYNSQVNAPNQNLNLQGLSVDEQIVSGFSQSSAHPDAFNWNAAGYGSFLNRVNGRSTYGVWARQLLGDDYFMSKIFSAMAYRDEKDDTTAKWLYLFEDGADDTLNIWKMDILEGAISLSATYDQTTAGKVIYAAAAYKPSDTIDHKEYEHIRHVRARPVGTGFVEGDHLGKAYRSVVNAECRVSHEWELINSDTLEVIDSGDFTSAPSKATPINDALTANPDQFIDKNVHIVARPKSGSDPNEFRSVNFRWFKSDQYHAIEEARIIRGVPGATLSGSGCNEFKECLRGTTELASGLIDGSAQYELNTMDWIELTLNGVKQFDYLNWAGTKLNGSWHWFSTYCLLGDFPAIPFNCRPISEWLYAPPCPRRDQGWHIWNAINIPSNAGFVGGVWNNYTASSKVFDRHLYHNTGNLEFYEKDPTTYPGANGLASKLIIHASARKQVGKFRMGQIKLGY